MRDKFELHPAECGTPTSSTRYYKKMVGARGSRLMRDKFELHPAECGTPTSSTRY
ncbi:MAG TPA: hypothetical protein PK821_01265 [Victivallales bacterium]|nr:hypothetical protein [Victivallales bacterium]